MKKYIILLVIVALGGIAILGFFFIRKNFSEGEICKLFGGVPEYGPSSCGSPDEKIPSFYPSAGFICTADLSYKGCSSKINDIVNLIKN